MELSDRFDAFEVQENTLFIFVIWQFFFQINVKSL